MTKKRKNSWEYRLEHTLRKKFVVISFSSVFGVMFVLALLINCFNYLQVTWKAEALTDIIASNDGILPSQPIENNGQMPPLEENLPPIEDGLWFPPLEGENQSPQGGPLPSSTLPSRFNAETAETTRFFTVTFDKNDHVIAMDTSKINRISPSEAMSLGIATKEGGKIENVEALYYSKIVEKSDGKTLIIFLDISEDLYFYQSFLISSLGICLLALACVLILLIFLSKKAVSPIVKTYERQKAFITDMSHELKTPLAIVKANTEVLELEHGESPWSGSIHKQIEKLNVLIIRLLSLAKLEESLSSGEHEEFSLSSCVEEAGENFRLLMEGKGHELQLFLESDLNYTGDAQGIRQVLDILLENAVKYSKADCPIVLSLKKEKHNLQILVKNQTENLKKGSYDPWFERFYREEGSRNSETGGFGLGLSMAKTLVKNHEGKISASSPDGVHVVFKVELKQTGNGNGQKNKGK